MIPSPTDTSTPAVDRFLGEFRHVLVNRLVHTIAELGQSKTGGALLLIAAGSLELCRMALVHRQSTTFPPAMRGHITNAIRRLALAQTAAKNGEGSQAVAWTIAAKESIEAITRD